MKVLKNIREFHFVLNFGNRKYKMVMWELSLFIVFMGLYSVISAIFPIERVPIDETMGDQYVLYMLLMLIDLIILGGMFFVGGMWFQDWKMEKRLKKNDQLSENLEMENLSQEEGKRVEPDHTN